MKKKYKSILIFLLFVLIVSSSVLVKELNNLDELWNYNFARNIANGLKPYKDFNIIITPLIPIICGAFLRIFGEELIIMRLLAILLNSTILFMAYKIMNELKINKCFSILFTLIICNIYYNYFCIDYNFAILIILLFIIYAELKSLEKTEKLIKLNIYKDILLGILVGSTILIKHTTGIVFSLIFIFHKILIVWEECDKKEIVKIILARLIGVFLPVLIFIIYLSSIQLWNDFLNYAIYGIKTFDNSVPYINLFKGKNLIIKGLAAIIPITFLYMYIKTIVLKLKTIEDKKIFIFFCYSIACFIVAFPISDNIHFLIGSMPIIIALIYIIYTNCRNTIKSSKIKEFAIEYIKAFTVITITIIAIASSVIIIDYIFNIKLSRLNHYKYIPLKSDEQINIMGNYIKNEQESGKKVYILDASACMYMIPIDIYNKDYDMFNKGNLGAKGEEGQIHNLENEENVIVLIKNEKYARNWQNPEQVRKYIIENWSKKGEINQFDIYEKELK